MFLIMCFVSPLTPLVLGKITITTYLWKSVSSLLLSVSVVYFVLFLVRTKWLPTEFITFIEGLAYKIPYIREVIIHRSAYRFSTSFLNTYSTGLPIFTSIESAIKSTGLVSAQQRWPAVFWQLKQGGELVSGLSEFRFLTPTSLGYLSTGQLSGSLDESLLTIKKESDEQLQIATKKLMKLLTFILEALVVFVVCKGYFAG
jgi:type II secretory pathway component PulF